MADEKKGGGISLGGLFGGRKDEGKSPGAGGGIGESIGGALFGKHETTSSFQITDLSNQINNLSRRLKMLEERYTNLRNKTQLTEQNMLESGKEVNRNIKAATSEMTELRRDFDDLKEKVKLIVKELKDTAKSEDVQLLERYIQMWEPVNFVTRNEVEKIVGDIVDERMTSLKRED